jgi:hypothetical protein
MTLRDLLRKPFWNPKDLSVFTGMSVSASRVLINKVRQSITDKGLLNINKTKVPVKEMILVLGIDVQWLEDTGALDLELNQNSGGK